MTARTLAAHGRLSDLIRFLRESRGMGHKRDISRVIKTLGAATATAMAGDTVKVGDDCAAIPDGTGGFLLFAIEGFLNEFCTAEPWFAGYCGVMVNVSDIYAMGGRPTAVVDALWSRNGDAAEPLLQGLAAAAEVYGVPIVGGHSNRRNDREQLAVAILGRANKLLTSFDARPGQHLVAAIDLRGRYHEPYDYWDASTSMLPGRLRTDLELLPTLAEEGLSAAGKDISMAGVVGTALMLLECSGVGATIDLDAIPRPVDVPLARWLTTFPSFGFLLSVDDAHLAEVQSHFTGRDIACASIGRISAGRTVKLKQGPVEEPLWDFNSEPLIGCGNPVTELVDEA
jgi:AIR synthase-related protein